MSTVSGSNARRQGIFWILTLPVPDATIGNILATSTLPDGIAWIKGQEECGDSGYRHYQVILGFSKKKSLAAVTKVFGTFIHAELTRSEAAEAYCVKEQSRVGEPFEFGAKPFRRNAAVDWEAVWESAKSGDLGAIPANVRVVSYRTLRAIQSDFSAPRGIERTVTVLWGPTGTGKSHRAWSEAGVDAYSKCPRTKFWDGYQDQGCVVIDEFRGGIDVSHLLRWFDRYPVRVEIKGSSRPFHASRVWITSNLEPCAWYPDLDHNTWLALERRLNIVLMAEPYLP